jgi:hypothetical protein
MIHVSNSAPAEVFSFVRQNERDKVFAVLNFSAESQVVTFQERLFHGHYTEYFSQEAVHLDNSTLVALAPWGLSNFHPIVIVLELVLVLEFRHYLERREMSNS